MPKGLLVNKTLVIGGLLALAIIGTIGQPPSITLN